jgi:hypothetical protein
LFCFEKQSNALLLGLGKNGKSLVDLGHANLGLVDGADDILRIHLKKHTGDLGSLAGVSAKGVDNHGVKVLTKKLLLGIRRHGVKLLEDVAVALRTRSTTAVDTAGLLSLHGRERASGGTATHVGATHATLGALLHRHHVAELGARALLEHGATTGVHAEAALLTLSLLTVSLGLVERDIETAGTLEDSTVHGLKSLGGAISVSEADVTDTSVHAVLSLDKLDRADLTELGELLTKSLLSDSLREELDVEVATSPALLLLHAARLSDLELLTAKLALGESAASEEGLGELIILNSGVVSSLDSVLGLVVSGVVNETEAHGLTRLGVALKKSRGDLAESSEVLLELLVGPREGDVLDIDVGEVLGVATTLLGLVDINSDGGTLDHKTSLGSINSGLSALLSLEVDETVAEGLAGVVSAKLNGKNVAETRELIEETLRVDRSSKVLNEGVTDTAATDGGVALRPADTAGLALKIREVHDLDGTLSIGGGVEVNITIAEGTTGNGVTAETDGSDDTDLRELIVKIVLSNLGGEITDICKETKRK